MNTKEDIEDYIRNLKAQAFDLVMEQDFCKNKITILEGEKLKILEELSNIYDTINTKLLAQKQQPYASGNIIPNNRLAASSAPTLVVNVENKTGKQVKATQSQPQFDGKRWIRTVMLELAEHDMGVPYKVNGKVVKPDFTKKGTKDEEKEE